jgi:hypothetical protein
LSIGAPEPSVTLVNSVKLGNVPSTKVQIAQKTALK